MAENIYSDRLAARKAVLQQTDQTYLQFGFARLGLVAGAIVLSIFGWHSTWLAWGLATIVALFVLLEIRMRGLDRSKQRCQLAIDYYQAGLDRLQGNWAGKGNSQQHFAGQDHPYAGDLDLFGTGSLFELLCRAHTKLGERKLADWLLAPAGREEVGDRQEAVRELAPRLELREELDLRGANLKTVTERNHLAEQAEADALATWGTAPRVFAISSLPILLWFVSLLGAMAGVLMVADLFGAPLPFTWARPFYLVMFLVCAGIVASFQKQAGVVFAGAETAGREAGLLASLLEQLEKEEFASAPLQRLQKQLQVAGLPPSRRFSQLRRLLDLADSRHHVFVRMLGFFVLYDLHLALALERWRLESGQSMPLWIAAVGEIEALSSLACFTYENPEYIFPEFPMGGRCFTAEGLGHPLLPKERMVRNNVDVNEELPLLVISGSNMSGKSTLLRTVGVNAVLAQAGAPVCATRLRMCRLAIGASIHSGDSLQSNRSRFYAEILRLRDIMSLADGPQPVLFLIDEILSGTNSHDRLIGARAILKGLVERGAMGLTSTHDLALTQIGESGETRGRNFHLEDQLVDGKMHFDYQLQPGVVTHSNAIALMKAIGLRVE